MNEAFQSTLLVARATMTREYMFLDPLGQNIQPHTEQKVRDCLSGLFQERLKSFLLGKLLSANAVEHVANFAFRYMDVQIGRFAEHPVGGDQESHDLLRHFAG